MREEDAPRPRPADQATRSDRGIETLDETVTTRRPASSEVRERTTRLAALDAIPAPVIPAETALIAPPPLLAGDAYVPTVDGVVQPFVRGETEMVGAMDGALARAAVSLSSGASYLGGIGNVRLATLLYGMARCLRDPGGAESLEPLEYLGARLVADISQTHGVAQPQQFGVEEIGTMLVKMARAMGVDPCSRTMKKIANQNDTVAKHYEKCAAEAAAKGDTVLQEQFLTRAIERQEHAKQLRKATR